MKLDKTVNSVSNIKYEIIYKSCNKYIRAMTNNYKILMKSQTIPGHPSVNFDSLKRSLVHVYENIPLETSNFQTEVNYYLNRKQTYSGNVVVITKIKDEQITYNLGRAAMEISVVTDYVPWRLHVETCTLTPEQALLILDGACRGFRQLLHRVRSPFIIQSNMIGVDGNGGVKVWWNQLFYKSNFGFAMSQNIKLREMVKSLIQVVLEKMKKSEADALEKQLFNEESTFVTLEDRIRQISKGFNFKQIGKSLVSSKQEYLVAMRQSGLIGVRQNSVLIDPLKISSASRTGHNTSSERIILTPRKQAQLQFNRKVITKRTYRGTSPTFQEKLQIIKSDIENLRSVAQKNPPPQISNSQVKMRSSKSVDTIFSYRKGLTGDTSIPQISKIIKESVVVGPNQDLTISRFVEPASQSMTSIQGNDHCNVCTNVQELRKSQITPQKCAHDPLFLSRLQHLVGQDKSINSTSRKKHMSTENIKSKFGESEKKLPSNVYFTTLFEA